MGTRVSRNSGRPIGTGPSRHPGRAAGKLDEEMRCTCPRIPVTAAPLLCFQLPVREAVYSESYEEACKVNEEETGKRISKQAWNICSKIREADKAFRDGVSITESHPEVIFKQLDESAVENSKNTEEGLQDRKQVLEQLGSIPDMENFTSSSVSEDDILDALVLSYAATQPLESLPENPKMDSEGVEMKIMKMAEISS